MSLLELDFKFPDWGGKLQAAEAELNLFTAAMIQTNRGMMFDQEGAHNGHQKWVPLRLRNGQILSNRGTMRKSLCPTNPRGLPGPDGIVRFAGDVISVGTRLGYARMMNDGTTKMPGGVLHAKNAKALKIPLPSGANATREAKKLRAVTIYERIAKLEESVGRATERAAKAKSRFMKSGSDKHLEQSVQAEYSLHAIPKKIDKLRLSASRAELLGRGGQAFIFRKSVKIPARNFTDWNQADQDELDAALVAKVIEVLNG